MQQKWRRQGEEILRDLQQKRRRQGEEISRDLQHLHAQLKVALTNCIRIAVRYSDLKTIFLNVRIIVYIESK